MVTLSTLYLSGVSLPINSVPAPFVNGDCEFWFERGIKNFANSSVGFAGGQIPYQSWVDTVQKPTLYFPASSSYSLPVSPGGSSLLRFNADRAFSIWWYQLVHSSSYHALCARDGVSAGNREWSFTYVKDGGALDGKTTFSVWDSSNTTILQLAENTTIDTWTHWVINYDHATTTFTLYKNSSSVASGSPSGTYNVTSQLLTLGDFSNLTVPGRGHCSQFIGFNRKLTGSEITALYNSGNGLFSI